MTNTKHADYRKRNDRQLNSSTYHKKDGTAVRAQLKQETEREAQLAPVMGSSTHYGPATCSCGGAVYDLVCSECFQSHEYHIVQSGETP